MYLFLPFFADLGLERNANTQRGLVVWCAVIVFFALIALWLATRRHGLLRTPSTPFPDTGAHGWPFMKKNLVGVLQLLAGVLAVYGLAQFTEPREKRPAGWHLIRPPHEASVLARQGDLIWAGGKEGVFAVNRQNLAPVPMPVLAAHDLREVRALLAEGDALWIGCYAGLYRYHAERLHRVAPRDGQDLGPVAALCRARDGALWVGTRDGAWRIDRGQWQHFGPAEGLSLPSIDVIFQDQEDDIWCGANVPESPGLFRFSRREGKFSLHSAGLPHVAVNDFMRDHTGALWAATGFGLHGAAARWENGQWTPLPDIPGIAGQKVRSIFEDSRHRLWFCSEYNGVAIRNGSTWVHLTPAQGLPGSEVKDMLEDEDGSLWLATERGLGCLRRFTLFDRPK